MQESASRAGRPGSALRFPGSSLSTVYREAKPASAEDRSGTGGQGSAREYARPSSAARSGRTFVRPLSASKFGREDAARPSSARLRPASSETISHGYSTSAGSRPDPWRGGRDGQVEIMVNEEGEPSPDMVSTARQWMRPHRVACPKNLSVAVSAGSCDRRYCRSVDCASDAGHQSTLCLPCHCNRSLLPHGRLCRNQVTRHTTWSRRTTFIARANQSVPSEISNFHGDNPFMLAKCFPT